MKKLISAVLAMLMVLSLTTTATAAKKKDMYKVTLTNVYLNETTAYTMGSYTVLEGKVFNKSKYRATVKKITAKVDIKTDKGHYQKTLEFNPKKSYTTNIQDGQLRAVLPTTIKGRTNANLKIFDDQVQNSIPMTMEPFIKSEYRNTEFVIKMVVNAKTKKKTVIRKKANKKAKVVSKIKAKKKVKVLGLPVKKHVKVKFGKKTGFIHQKFLK